MIANDDGGDALQMGVRTMRSYRPPPKRAGQGKTEKNQQMRTGPFPRPRGRASARVMAVFCMGRVAAWHVHHPQHRRAVRLEKPHEEHVGKTKKDHVQARRVVQRDVRLDDHGRALTRHQSERLEDQLDHQPGHDHSGVRRREEEQRSEEHTSELQSLAYLVCRLLLEKKKKQKTMHVITYKT